MLKIAVFASGKGSNFKNIVEYFRNKKTVIIDCLVCDQPNAPVIELSRSYNIEVFIAECSKFKTKLEDDIEKQLVQYLTKRNIELILLAGYMRVVKSSLLKAFHNKIINIHPSLLPSFKGLNAVKQALDYGVKYTGCTVHYVNSDLDGGPIIDQLAVRIEETDNENSLLEKIHKEEHKLYPRVIENIASRQNK